MWTVDVWSASKQELKSKLMAPVANCHRRTHAPQYTSAALLEMQRYIKVERLSDLEVRPCKVAITGGCLLVARVDDLYPSIFARVRSSRILQLGLAVADRHQVARVDAIFFEKQPLDRLGAAFGQPLKLTGDLGNAFEAAEIGGRRSNRLTTGKLSPSNFGLLQQYRPRAETCGIPFEPIWSEL